MKSGVGVGELCSMDCICMEVCWEGSTMDLADWLGSCGLVLRLCARWFDTWLGR